MPNLHEAYELLREARERLDESMVTLEYAAISAEAAGWEEGAQLIRNYCMPRLIEVYNPSLKLCSLPRVMNKAQEEHHHE